MTGAAGIVLAGGRSSRMGTPKADLEWHGSTLLRRVTGIVARGAGGPIVVVRAPGQQLPALPKGVVQGPSVEGITEYRLPNGLKVLLFPDSSRPTKATCESAARRCAACRRTGGPSTWCSSTSPSFR